MNEKLQKIKEYCLNDVDSETYEENRQEILELEKSLNDAEMYKSWQEHEITKRIKAFAKKEYVETCKLIALDRKLTGEQISSLWARQDAMMWILELGSNDTDSEVRDINLKLDQILSRI